MGVENEYVGFEVHGYQVGTATDDTGGVFVVLSLNGKLGGGGNEFRADLPLDADHLVELVTTLVDRGKTRPRSGRTTGRAETEPGGSGDGRYVCGRSYGKCENE